MEALEGGGLWFIRQEPGAILNGSYLGDRGHLLCAPVRQLDMQGVRGSDKWAMHCVSQIVDRNVAGQVGKAGARFSQDYVDGGDIPIMAVGGGQGDVQGAIGDMR